ncbi:unnamed protein product [Strongylus vulgaris]|uniref:Ig-like domain-containing protein n=1 Tax=Strongylus vulgaris TaxID=40348 RepID=A0A3P7LE02_STRVU|nr:unnamed protein product [Strongylus vulgaris]
MLEALLGVNRNNPPEPNAPSALVVGDISVLIIHKVNNTDDGVYKCEATNECGTVVTAANVTIGDIRCHFDTSFPEISEAEAGEDIKSVESTDSGTYRCETSDGRSKTEGELHIKETKSHIILGPQDQVITRCGDTATLSCELSHPSAVIKWFKNGKEIWQQASKYSLTNEGCTSKLEILNFERSDIGDYHAALDEEELSVPAHISLEVPPAIEVEEGIKDKVLVKAHDELDFHVKISGEPAPSVTILHNNSQIKERALVKVDGETIRIRMKNLTLVDSGIVSISAESSNGTAKEEFEICVLDVPSAPLQASIQQRSIDVKHQKQPECEDMRDNETKDAVTKIELEEVGAGKAVKVRNESDAAPTSTRKRGAPILSPVSDVVTVKTGEPAKISVNVEGSMDVHCLWKKDGNSIMVRYL